MHLFLIVSAPLAYVYVLMLRGEAREPASRVGASALRGLIAYLVQIPLILVLNRFVSRAFDGPEAYFHAVLFDFALPIVGTFLLYSWFTPRLRALTGRERRVSMMSFYAGAFSLAGVMDLFLRANFMGIYELFLIPGLRVVALLIVPVLYKRFAEETFWVRGFYIAAIIALPFGFAVFFLLTVLNLQLVAILGTAALILAAWLVTLLGSLRAKGVRK